MKRKKNILVLITHSFGELDVLFPLFSGFRPKQDVDIKIVFAIRKLYRKYMTNDFYRFCASELGIKITSCQLPNKFDYRDSILMQSRVGRLLITFYFKLLRIIKFPILFPKLFWADVYMHEASKQKDSTQFLYWAKNVYNKPIYCYPHGHNTLIDTNVKKKRKFSDEIVMLVFHNHSNNYWERYGYNNQYIVGYPKFFEEWKSLVMKFPSRKFNREEIVVIFSRPVSSYMDEDKYIELFISTFKVIRDKLDDIQIVIKPHPREETDFIKEILFNEGLNNYCFSHEDVSLLSQNAVLAISFWTSAILVSLANGVPSVEYYIESEKFREYEPDGSVFKKLGIDSVSDQTGLTTFIDIVINKKYKTPKMISEISNFKDVNYLNI